MRYIQREREREREHCVGLEVKISKTGLRGTFILIKSSIVVGVEISPETNCTIGFGKTEEEVYWYGDEQRGEMKEIVIEIWVFSYLKSNASDFIF